MIMIFLKFSHWKKGKIPEKVSMQTKMINQLSHIPLGPGSPGSPSSPRGPDSPGLPFIPGSPSKPTTDWLLANNS